MTELVIHILNYRTPNLTMDCLRSLAAERALYPDFSVILIDNASGDDSATRIAEALRHEQWTSWVRFLPLDQNLGFAGDNNHAIRLALDEPDCPPFQLLLNSDTIVHPGCLATSVAWMRDHPDTGAFSCMLRNPDGTVQNVCRKFPRPDRETARALGLPYLLPRLFSWADLEEKGWNRETSGPREVEWIGGAFMLLRTAAIRQVGVMDETFFFYGEDCEWCHRLWRNRWKVIFNPAGSITHLGGASSDPTRLLDKRKEILIWKARFLVQQRCYGRLSAWWIRGVYIYAFAARKLWFILSGQRGTLKYQGCANGLQTLTRPLDPNRV